MDGKIIGKEGTDRCTDRMDKRDDGPYENYSLSVLSEINRKMM